MEKLFNAKIKNVIRDTLKLDESLSAQEKKFSFNSDFLSNDNFQNHIELYEGYIKNFNEVSAKLDTADRQNVNCNHSEFRSLKLDETFNMNGVYLHELYFANIGDTNSEIKMDSLSYMRLSRDFGSFDAWQKDFIACAAASQCGWAITYLNTYTQTYMNAVVDLHSNNIPFGSYPIIVMDAWQHAYYRDYLKDVTTYTRAMMKLLRWPVIEERIQKADKIIQALRS
jgi:Fe-Mn family superoxide dismutase|tara:strand:+ start:1623 stop:2300 length:678 start_codon:yes stop_codon:yes gene_type:complete